MDPFKTGLFATALVSLGKSGRFHNGLVFIGYRMDRNCVTIVYGESELKQIAKIKMTGSITDRKKN